MSPFAENRRRGMRYSLCQCRPVYRTGHAPAHDISCPPSEDPVAAIVRCPSEPEAVLNVALHRIRAGSARRLVQLVGRTHGLLCMLLNAGMSQRTRGPSRSK